MTQSQSKAHVQAQHLIPQNVDICQLPSLVTSLTGVYAHLRASTGKFRYFEEAEDHKALNDVQESWNVMVTAIDKCHGQKISDIPVFVMQDQAQTRAVSIEILSLRDLSGLPLICVRYFPANRDDDIKASAQMMSSIGQGRQLQEIPSDVDEIKAMIDLFNKNRSRMSQKRVKLMEKQWCVFLDFQIIIFVRASVQESSQMEVVCVPSIQRHRWRQAC